jgi:hypothetical protein
MMLRRLLGARLWLPALALATTGACGRTSLDALGPSSTSPGDPFAVDAGGVGHSGATSSGNASGSVEAGGPSAVACPVTCGGTCTATGCLYTLATEQDHPVGIAVYGETVFWTNGPEATVMTMSLADGAPPAQVLYTPREQLGEATGLPDAVGSIIVFPPYLEWWAISTQVEEVGPTYRGYGTAWIQVARLDGGPPYRQGESAGEGPTFGELAGIPNGVFGTDPATNGITIAQIYPRYGVAEEDDNVTEEAPFGIASDVDVLYWTRSTASGSVRKASISYQQPPRVPLILVTPVVVASNQDTPGWLASDEANLYWVNMGSGSIAKVSKSGGPVTTLATGQDKPFGIVVNGSQVFWTNRSGTVMSVSTEGGDLTTLASGQDAPYAVAADATGVYWTNNDSVMRLTTRCPCP